MTLEELMALLKDATPEKKKELMAMLGMSDAEKLVQAAQDAVREQLSNQHKTDLSSKDATIAQLQAQLQAAQKGAEKPAPKPPTEGIDINQAVKEAVEFAQKQIQQEMASKVGALEQELVRQKVIAKHAANLPEFYQKTITGNTEAELTASALMVKQVYEAEQQSASKAAEKAFLTSLGIDDADSLEAVKDRIKVKKPDTSKPKTEKGKPVEISKLLEAVDDPAVRAQLAAALKGKAAPEADEDDDDSVEGDGGERAPETPRQSLTNLFRFGAAHATTNPDRAINEILKSKGI